MIIVFSFLAELVMIKYLSVSDKGTFFYLRNNIEWIAISFTFGLNFSIIHFRSSGKHSVDKQIFMTIILSVLFCLLFSFFGSFVEKIRVLLYVHKSFFFVATIVVVLRQISLYIEKLLLSEHKLFLHNLFILLHRTIVNIFIIICAILSKDPILYALVAMILVYLFCNVFFMKYIKFNFAKVEKRVSILKYSVYSYLYELCFQLKNKGENILIFSLFGTSALGVISVAKSFCAINVILSSSIGLILFKSTSSQDVSLKQFIKINFLFFPILFFVYFGTGFMIFLLNKFYFPESYSQALYYFIFIGLAGVFGAYSEFLQYYLLGKGVSQVQLYSILISLVPFLLIFIYRNLSIVQFFVIVIISNLVRMAYSLIMIIYYNQKKMIS
jgi:O-antigen/teichoic acid export membrane protein